MSDTQDTGTSRTRKHLYLITEHEDEDFVGRIRITDKRESRASKNDETPFHGLDKEAGEFYIKGKQVSMGYVDFEDEDDYEENIGDAIDRKLREIDEEHHEKAGVELDEVAA